MRRNLVCLLGGIAFALYLFLPAPPRFYVPAGFVLPVIAWLLVPLAYRRFALGEDLPPRELFVALLLAVFLGLLMVLPFLEGPVALAFGAAMMALLYGGMPSAQSSGEAEAEGEEPSSET